MDAENESSPSGARSVAGTGNEDVRLIEMENRIIGLEERLANALEEVQEARSREMGLLLVMREVIGHLASGENSEYTKKVLADL